jgi:hypothetical protein
LGNSLTFVFLLIAAIRTVNLTVLLFTFVTPDVPRALQVFPHEVIPHPEEHCPSLRGLGFVDVNAVAVDELDKGQTHIHKPSLDLYDHFAQYFENVQLVLLDYAFVEPIGEAEGGAGDLEGNPGVVGGPEDLIAVIWGALAWLLHATILLNLINGQSLNYVIAGVF